MRLTPTFFRLKDAYLKNPRYIDSCGGTRSGKTYAALQLLYFVALADKTPKLTSVVSETFPHLKRGAIRDFQNILSADGLWNDAAWSKTDYIYKLPNGSKIEFFSADQPAKVHGPARDRMMVNEAVNISWDTFRQLDIRTRDWVIYDYNPTHAFWAQEQIQPGDNCICVNSTYKDNPFLTEAQTAAIEANKGDGNWWRVYGQGLVGQLQGVIFDFEQIDSLPDDGIPVIGVDFGFSGHPTAIIYCKIDPKRRIIHADEVCYKTGLKNGPIAEILKQFPRVEVYADCAEPKSIAEIGDEGVNIMKCDKGAPPRSDKLTFQIQWLQGWKLKVTKQSINLIKELRNYVWAQDANGKMLNYPVDAYNHAIDALRYAAWTKFAKNPGQGKYQISIL